MPACKIKNYLFIIILLTIGFSYCTKPKNKSQIISINENKKILNLKNNLFDSLISLNDSTYKRNKSNELKLIIIADGDCSCGLVRMLNWNKMLSKYSILNKPEIYFIFFSNLDRKEILEYNINNKYHIKFPIYLVKKNYLFNNNKLKILLQNKTSLILNEKIILTGALLKDKNILEDYILEISKLTSSDFEGY